MKRTFSIAQAIGSMISILYMIALSYIMMQANEYAEMIQSWSLVGEQLFSLCMIAHLAVIFIATMFQILSFMTNRFSLSIFATFCYFISWFFLPIGMIVLVPVFIFSICGSVFTKKWKLRSSENNKQFIQQPTGKPKPKSKQGKQQVQRPKQTTISSDEMRSKIAQKNPMLQASVDKHNLKKSRIPRFSTSDPEYIHQNNRIPLQMQQANQADPMMNPMQYAMMSNMMQYQPYPMQGYAQNFQQMQDPYAMYPNQTMNYGASAELVTPMIQEPPRPRPKQTISDGYFDDFGKFHPN